MIFGSLSLGVVFRERGFLRCRRATLDLGAMLLERKCRVYVGGSCSPPTVGIGFEDVPRPDSSARTTTSTHGTPPTLKEKVRVLVIVQVLNVLAGWGEAGGGAESKKESKSENFGFALEKRLQGQTKEKGEVIAVDSKIPPCILQERAAPGKSLWVKSCLTITQLLLAASGGGSHLRPTAGRGVLMVVLGMLRGAKRDSGPRGSQMSRFLCASLAGGGGQNKTSVGASAVLPCTVGAGYRGSP